MKIKENCKKEFKDQVSHCACPCMTLLCHVSSHHSFCYQVRPHGGIFFDGITQDSEVYRMNYTLVVNDLALYSVSGLGELFAYVNFEVHRR